MSNYRPAFSWHFVFTRENGRGQGGWQRIFTRENGCSLLRRTENGPSFERVQIANKRNAARVATRRGAWPDEPRSFHPCSTRNPGQPGFRTSGVRKITVLEGPADRRPLLRFESPRSTAMRDPPK